jgi:hypothetical protein
LIDSGEQNSMKLHRKENCKQGAASTRLEERKSETGSTKRQYLPSASLCSSLFASCSLPKLSRWLCFVAIFFSITALAAQAAGEIVIKVATLAPQGSEWYKILQEMGAEWQKVSNGLIVFRLYPGVVAGDDIDLVRKMRGFSP